ncbi:MAG: hypothetical protein WBA22_13620 [Candidatus Methanofastidiosia archaeon]
MIKEGTIVEGPFWPEPIEVKKVGKFGNRIHIIGATIYSNIHIDQLIPEEEIKYLKKKADKLLDFLRSEVTDYVVRQILHNGIAGELTALTKFYILWRWTFQEKKVKFDEARKLAQSTGIDLEREWNKGFIVKDGEFIEVLGSYKRDIKSLEKPVDLIDTLHHALILYRDGRREELKKVLQESEWGERDAFYRVAQAISETLPSQSKEKTLLETFLQEKERLIREVKTRYVQKRLFE